MHMQDKIVKDSIQPLLKSHQFKKKGLQWNRDRGCFVDVITVQEAKHSTEDAEVFTLNLGVFVPSFFEAVWSRALSGFATEADCAVRLRLGDLMQGKLYGDAVDQWWTLSDSGSSESSSDEIRRAIEEKVIPFFARFDTFEAIAGHLRQMRGWQANNPLMTIYRALAEWKSGSTSLALQVLDGVKGKAWESKASAVVEMINSAENRIRR